MTTQWCLVEAVSSQNKASLPSFESFHMQGHFGDCVFLALQELSKLQDKVPAFASDKALSIVERELGAPASQIFRQFDERPIAAASLGQVWFSQRARQC